MCSLDVVNTAAYLAFLDPEEAKSMRFHLEDLYEKRKEIESKEEEEDLVSQITEECSLETDDDMSVGTDDLLTPNSQKSFDALAISGTASIN
jgi:hypothetical protein